MIGMVDRLVRALSSDRVEVPLELPPDVEIRRSRWIPTIGGRLSHMGAPASAVTLGRTILLHPDAVPTARLLRHELAHVEQWIRHPYAFPFRYTAAHIRHGYRDNPYESEARAAESSARATGETG